MEDKNNKLSFTVGKYLPGTSLDVTAIEQASAEVKNGIVKEILWSGSETEVPIGLLTTVASLLSTELPMSISISRKNSQDPNNYWSLKIGPPQTKEG